ncbi:Mur ligase family protein [Clavibacter tessellarius]|uniref:Mur ligase family protein n=1 Tax=Clavibacter tessellarius TaxID=31965 RepID=UPI0039BEE39B
MPLRLAVAAGRAARWAARLRGGGSAVPGVVALRLEPRFLERTIADLPHGVVAVTGSNGKSTTTHMLTAVLRAHGLRVFTNPPAATCRRASRRPCWRMRTRRVAWTPTSPCSRSTRPTASRSRRC